MRTKIVRNIFISVGVLFAFTRLVAASMNDGVLNFSDTPFLRPQPTIITFDVPGASTGPFQGTHGNAISPQGTVISTSSRVYPCLEK
jgi:hypothetical protein